MKVIKLEAEFFKPKLRILKNYIITFKNDLLKLYDLEGNLLDNVKFKNRDILNIEIINDNFIIVATSFSILIMKIKFQLMEFREVKKYWTIIENIFLINNKNLLAICILNRIEIYDINNLNEKPIQVINNDSFSNFNFNSNIFISYNYEYISLYQNIKGTKIYQLSSKIKLEGNKYLTKLNGNILLILLNNQILYTMNIRNMQITAQINVSFQIITEKKHKGFLSFQIFNFGKKYGYIYNNKNDIYIYTKNILYYIKYINNGFQIIKSFEIDELRAINYISNKYIKLDNLKINCIYNNYNKYSSFFGQIIFALTPIKNNNDIVYYRPIKSKKELKVKEYLFKKELKHKKNKNKFIRKKNLNYKKIVNNPKSFKKKYR